MKTFAYVLFVLALLAGAFAVIALMWGGCYAVVAGSLMLATRQIPNDTVDLIALCYSISRYSLSVALTFAVGSGSLALAHYQNTSER